MDIYKISITCHDQYGIQIYNDGSIEDFQKVRDFLKMAVLDNYIDSVYYKAKSRVKPFLQSDCEDFVMVEFWTDNFEYIDEYIYFLNNKYKEWIN